MEYVLIIGVLSIASIAAINGSFYDTQDGRVNTWIGRIGVHGWSWLHALTIYALLWLAGAGPWELLGICLVGDACFQALVNVSVGRPVLYRGEAQTWDVWGLKYPKPFSGRTRLAQFVLGVVVLAAGHLPWVRPAVAVLILLFVMVALVRR